MASSQGGALGAVSSNPQGPPYAPQTWQLGGATSVGVDVPVTSVFLFLFLLGATMHFKIFLGNMKIGHFFFSSLFCFIFCMSRIVTTSMRIASTVHPRNLKLAIAANVFVAAGVVILFLVNLIFTKRLVRATQPKLGWSKPVSIIFTALFVLTFLTIIMMIVVTIQSFFTLNTNTRAIDRSIQLYGATFFAIISFLPIPLVALALIARPKSSKAEKFAKGRFRTKVYVLMTGATLLCLGASYRAGTAWLPPVPRSRPLPDYFHKACFYVFNFAVEIIVVYFYALMRIDQRFHIPNGAKGPGSYSGQKDEEEVMDMPTEPLFVEEGETKDGDVSRRDSGAFKSLQSEKGGDAFEFGVVQFNENGDLEKGRVVWSRGKPAEELKELLDEIDEKMWVIVRKGGFKG
ncbi:hypothetical protein H2199_003536 [Coniosporium tulheliwenetii]|uniref:Uncharacterized protein n=1 Tax=Coniosporium tulheliwenetii TaxID=3383036 RepID=A0ACC2ZBD1_9PEZI|nr:hypothetical protein H2199_003536 [Cladosporium sp. JES 115]